LADKKEIEKMVKRSMVPSGFRLKKHPILIDVVDRTYGIYCECGCRDFSEDDEACKLCCSACEKVLAIRAIEDGWVED
jgi:hypothetical protein